MGLWLALAAIVLAGSSSPVKARSNGAEDNADEAHDEETALARMLSSETDHPGARIVLGWMTIESARRRGVSVFRRLTGTSGEYGPQKHNGQIRYAATTKPPTAETRALARDLLAGRVRPSRAIRDRGIGAWVELGVAGYTPKKMLDKQFGPKGLAGGKTEDGYGGIYGRIEDSTWFLYHQKAPLLEYDLADPDSAARVLALVPVLPALDEGPAVS